MYIQSTAMQNSLGQALALYFLLFSIGIHVTVLSDVTVSGGDGMMEPSISFLLRSICRIDRPCK